MVAGGKFFGVLTIDDVHFMLNLCSQGTVVSQEAYDPAQSRQDPSDLCNRYCSMLDLDQKTTNLSIMVAIKVKAAGTLAGRSPLSAAAAIIFFSAHLLGVIKTFKALSDVIGVSESTIRQAYKKLYDEQDSVIDDEILARGVKVERLPKPA